MPGALPADADADRHLEGVCATLGARLRQGVERVLACVQTAEDKELLAANALALLQHHLTGALHAPRPSALDAGMRTLATRATAAAIATPSPAATQTQRDDYVQLLQKPRVRQALDGERAHLLLEVSGVLAPHLFSAGHAVLQLRLDVHLQCGACMAWEAAWQAGHSGERMALVARTPWDGVLRSTAVSEGELRVDLELLTDDGRRQRLGYEPLLSPAALMQQSALGASPSASEVPQWPKVTESFVAVSDNPATSPAFLSGAQPCNAEATVKQLGGATRLDVSAPSLLELAGYANAARQSVPDGVQLRLLRSTPPNLAALEQWCDALQQEIRKFRSAAAEHCSDGFDEEAVRRLMALQITLDEAAGRCAEALHSP